MNIISECGDLCFRHLIGSALINNRSPDSDVDWLNVHKISLTIDPFFSAYNNHYSIVNYTDTGNDNATLNDSTSIDVKELINILTQLKDLQPLPYYSKILSHL